jgi:hypothetical protein
MRTLEALRAVLLTDSAVVGLVAQRIYAVVAPPEAARPFIVMTRIDLRPENTFTGTSASEVLVQIDCYSDKYSFAADLQEAVKNALKNQRNSLKLNLTSIELASVRDDYEPETQRHRIGMDYRIYTSEGI